MTYKSSTMAIIITSFPFTYAIGACNVNCFVLGGVTVTLFVDYQWRIC